MSGISHWLPLYDCCRLYAINGETYQANCPIPETFFMKGCSLASSWVSERNRAYLSHTRDLFHPIPAVHSSHLHRSSPHSNYRISFVLTWISRNWEEGAHKLRSRRYIGKGTNTGQSSPTASFLFPFEVSSSFDSFTSFDSSDIAPVAFKYAVLALSRIWSWGAGGAKE